MLRFKVIWYIQQIGNLKLNIFGTLSLLENTQLLVSTHFGQFVAFFHVVMKQTRNVCWVNPVLSRKQFRRQLISFIYQNTHFFLTPEC